jgi:hypothetical protein
MKITRDEDQCHIGYCCDLSRGGVCHGNWENATYASLSSNARDEVAYRQAKGSILPASAVRPTVIPKTPRPADFQHNEQMHHCLHKNHSLVNIL